MQRFIQRIGVASPQDMSAADSNSITRRFGKWLGLIWQWSFTDASQLRRFPWISLAANSCPRSGGILSIRLINGHLSKSCCAKTWRALVISFSVMTVFTSTVCVGKSLCSMIKRSRSNCLSGIPIRCIAMDLITPLRCIRRVIFMMTWCASCRRENTTWIYPRTCRFCGGVSRFVSGSCWRHNCGSCSPASLIKSIISKS